MRIGSKAAKRNVLEDTLWRRLDELNAHKDFLCNGLSVAIEDYRKKFNNNCTSEEALKDANWEFLKYQSLIEQDQLILTTLETVLATLNHATCNNRIFQRAIVTLMRKEPNAICSPSKVDTLQDIERPIHQGFEQRHQVENERKGIKTSGWRCLSGTY